MPAGEESVTAYLGLGSNLGDRRASMRAAVEALNAHPHIQVDLDRGVAPLYETSPVGGPVEQPPYLNSVARITTTLTPHDLLAAARTIEIEIGRTRGERWGPRVIDIDILLYAELVLRDEILSIPHPRMHERRFVLEPLSEIAGGLVHPGMGRTIADLARECPTGDEQGTVVLVEVPAEWVPNSSPPAKRGGRTRCPTDSGHAE